MTKKANIIYGIIGVVAVFLIGGISGYIINGAGHINNSAMSLSQCQDVARKIVWAADNNKPDLILQLNKVFSENCNDRIFEKPQPKPETKEVAKPKLPTSTCEAIEELLKNNLNDEFEMESWAHEENANVYKTLAVKGCEQNREEYAKLAVREMEIAKALNNEATFQDNHESTCDKIEAALTERLRCNNSNKKCYDSDQHISDAQIYANLSERGCPGNSEKYKALAKQELDIARALNDDNIERDPGEAIEIVETYKRLQMQAEAERMIEKAKKIANPAIDFIIQLEKIIEE